MKLALTIDRQLNIMTKHHLTAEEWFFIELLFIATDDPAQPDYLYKYFTECKKESLPRDILKSLKQKKVLSSLYDVPGEGEDFDLDEIEFSDSFIKNYFVTTFEGGEELLATYPDFLQFGDRLLPAKNITKSGFLSLEAFCHHYNKAIRSSIDRHNSVIASLEWAKENNLLTYGIAEYVITRRWNDHLKMMESGEIGKFAVKVSTLEDI